MGAIPFPDPPLCDGVVLLRRWHQQDAEVKAGWGGDPDIVRWTSVPRGYTQQAARAQAARNEVERLEGRLLGLEIADAGSGGLLGACELRCPEPVDLQVMSVGYVLSLDQAHPRRTAGASRTKRHGVTRTPRGAGEGR